MLLLPSNLFLLRAPGGFQFCGDFLHRVKRIRGRPKLKVTKAGLGVAGPLPSCVGLVACVRTLI